MLEEMEWLCSTCVDIVLVSIGIFYVIQILFSTADTMSVAERRTTDGETFGNPGHAQKRAGGDAVRTQLCCLGVMHKSVRGGWERSQSKAPLPPAAQAK